VDWHSGGASLGRSQAVDYGRIGDRRQASERRGEVDVHDKSVNYCPERQSQQGANKGTNDGSSSHACQAIDQALQAAARWNCASRPDDRRVEQAVSGSAGEGRSVHTRLAAWQMAPPAWLSGILCDLRRQPLLRNAGARAE
jgi:mevalonate pyrophosphate decarboxylase